MSGFLPFEGSESKFSIGQIIDTVVIKLSSNGRVCSVSEDSEKQSNSFVRFVVSPVVLEFIFSSSFLRSLLSTPSFRVLLLSAS